MLLSQKQAFLVVQEQWSPTINDNYQRPSDILSTMYGEQFGTNAYRYCATSNLVQELTSQAALSGWPPTY